MQRVKYYNQIFLREIICSKTQDKLVMATLFNVITKREEGRKFKKKEGLYLM